MQLNSDANTKKSSDIGGTGEHKQEANRDSTWSYGFGFSLLIQLLRPSHRVCILASLESKNLFLSPTQRIMLTDKM